MLFLPPYVDGVKAYRVYSGDARNHIPFARSGAEIKNFDLALWRALSQQVPNESDYVATHKLSKQVVLDIHSLYASG